MEMCFFSIIFQGWIRNIRKKRNCIFCDVDDGSNLKGVQVVLGPKNKERYGDELEHGVSVIVSGKLATAPRLGNLELSDEEFTIKGTHRELRVV